MAISNWSKAKYNRLIDNETWRTCLIECTMNGAKVNAVCAIYFDHENDDYIIVPQYIEVNSKMDLRGPDGQKLVDFHQKKK